MISICGFVSIFCGGDSCFLIKGIRKVNYYTYMAIAVGSKVVWKMCNESICRRRNRENMSVLYTGIVKAAYKQFLIAIMRLPVYDDTESEL